MKKKMLILVLLMGAILFTGCHKNSDDELDFIPGDANYDLTLENDTEEEIEIYLQGFTSEDFERKGLLAPGEEMVIQLTVEYTYVVRAVNVGESQENYFFQESITRLSPADLTLMIRN
ncbi:hypothetical protein FHG64_13255 [Antarcticibacterium flavum]|uniref:Uncharacterized protein n=1 Tax=Antarcticibacterium flavum TaxID=2058175 RepID=A0A5B7X477_9FLAO|nr:MULTISPECIES: hypothetical protein [Antarcticibacterium]MCM4158548.1 hypothetical protein [Antarcticibacterium sp. W02-3]QCY70294.1 hypothetical protein FHG64_13255 [Antarcticibacterium flavum]